MKEKLTEIIVLRVSEREKNTIKLLAQLYAGGNMSAYIVDRAIYSNRKMIADGDFELSNRKVRKGAGKPAPSLNVDRKKS